MITIALDAAPDRASAHALIGEPVFAAIAVRAANGVPGVVRVEPGLAGLVSSVARSARQRLKGLNPAPTEGARVRFGRTAADLPAVHLDVAVTVAGSAVEIGQAVQRVVTTAVAEATGVTPTSVSVSVVDIELPGTRA